MSEQVLFSLRQKMLNKKFIKIKEQKQQLTKQQETEVVHQPKTYRSDIVGLNLQAKNNPVKVEKKKKINQRLTTKLQSTGYQQLEKYTSYYKKPEFQELQFDSQLECLKGNFLLRVQKQNKPFKDNLLIFNYNGLLIKKVFAQNPPLSILLLGQNNNNTQQIPHHVQQIKHFIEKLSQYFTIVLLINKNQKLHKAIQSLQIGIYEIQQDCQIFIDCKKIQMDYDCDQFKNIYYFMSIDGQCIEKDGIQVINHEKCLEYKLPKLFHENLRIIVFQNIEYDDNVMNQIWKFIRTQKDIYDLEFDFDEIYKPQTAKNFRNNFLQKISFVNKCFTPQKKQTNFKLQKINNIYQLYYTLINRYHKLQGKQKFLNKIENLKQQYNLQYDEYQDKPKKPQFQIYHKLKQKAQDSGVQLFFSLIGEMFQRNNYLNLSYHQQGQKLLQNLNEIDYVQIDLQFQLEQDLFNVIHNNMFCFFSENI